MNRRVFEMATAKKNAGQEWKLPKGNGYTPSQITTVYAIAKAMQEEVTFVTADWPQERMTGEEWLRWFRRKLEFKLYCRDHPDATERKLMDRYQEALDRLRPYIGNRLVVHYVDPILGSRVIEAMRHQFRDEQTYDRLHYTAKLDERGRCVNLMPEHKKSAAAPQVQPRWAVGLPGGVR